MLRLPPKLDVLHRVRRSGFVTIHTRATTQSAPESYDRGGIAYTPDHQDLPFHKIAIINKAYDQSTINTANAWTLGKRCEGQSHTPAEKPSTGCFVNSVSCRRSSRVLEGVDGAGGVPDMISDSKSTVREEY